MHLGNWIPLLQIQVQDILLMLVPYHDENYAANSGNFLPTFRDNLLIPPSGVKLQPNVNIELLRASVYLHWMKRFAIASRRDWVDMNPDGQCKNASTGNQPPSPGYKPPWLLCGKKADPLQASSGPEGSTNLRYPDFLTTAQDDGKVVSLTHRPHLHPGNSPGIHFC
jgi:hypothetical protein